MNLKDNLPDDNCTKSGWGYNYILSWIRDATRMNRQEYENWREIQTLQKKDPNFIRRYLMILKSKEKVSIKNLTKIIEDVRKASDEKIDKKEELLKLLNDTEKKIIAEILKGTDFNKIYQKVGISLKTFPCYMSDIYRRTRNIIPYGKGMKRPVLVGYLFNECGFADGRSEASPDSEQIEPTAAKPHRRNSVSVEQIQDSGFADGRSEASPDSEQIEPTAAKPHRRNSVSVEQIQDSGFADGRSASNISAAVLDSGLSNSVVECGSNVEASKENVLHDANIVSEDKKAVNTQVCEKSENISEQNAKVLENMLIDFGVDRILDSLKVSRDFLRGKYKKLCENLGDLLVQSSADKAQESPDYMLAHDYDDAIWGLTRAIVELEGE